MKNLSRLFSVTIGCVALLSGAPAQADDSEVFTSASFTSSAKPNVLFIIDTSGSMDTAVNVFNSKKVYSGACDPNKVYWRSEDTAEPPDCATTNQWVSVGSNRCRAAFLGMDSGGWWRGRSQMLIKKDASGNNLNPTYWGDFQAKVDGKIECRSDDAEHGDLPGSDAPGSENKRARNGSGTNDSNRWGNNSAGSLLDWGTKNRFSLYSGNYANWYATTDDGDTKTRMEIVREVAKNMVNSLNGVNLGIMRYDRGAHGGMVTYPVSDLTTASRAAMNTMLDGFAADGFTPLSETMFEAYRYMAGGNVAFGLTSSPAASVATSRSPQTAAATKYDSPMDQSCQSNYIIYLTDGLPTQDNEADGAIETVSGKTCPAQIIDPDPSYPTSGRCLETITGYMNQTDLRTDVIGNQKVVTYMIGFGTEVAKSQPFMNAVAKAGGTENAFTTGDAAGLTATLEQIFSGVVDGSDTTFVAPTVSVNAFNRSQNLNELYVSVFAPSKLTHWAGNLKKYRIYKSDIHGTGAAAPAVDADGFFADSSQAINSANGVVDGPKTVLGGAAASLPVPSDRKLYTWLTGQSKDLTNADNAIKDGNAKITKELVGAVDADERTLVIDYARGVDVHDENKAGTQHYRMGDPMHARPAILVHAGTETKPEGTIFVPTNDGFLHAFQMNSQPDNSDGSATVTPTTERWAFVPEDFLGRLGLLYDDAPLGNRTYALDGDVRVFKYDIDQDGLVEAADGDKAYIFFGTGRGGSSYYSLDVTDPDNPQYRWKISNATTGFAKLGRTWSAPQIARMNIAGVTQNAQKLVLVFGGGYDTAQDSEPTTYSYAEDSVGNALYIVDLETGNLLWTASKTGVAGANFTHAEMTHSIPANITVLDTDGDRLADRMYAADMGGQIWRFDVTNGNAVGSLVAGGPLASLGNKGLAAGSRNYANNRRFYYAPDAAPISARGSTPYMNLAIGSGYRGHPLSAKTQDSFYSIRDYMAAPRNQAWYNGLTVIKDADASLLDVTDIVDATVGDTKSGWKLRLKEAGTAASAWRGEKVLAESTTASGVIFFPTFTPTGSTDPCLAGTLNRAWAVYASNARPFTNWTNATATTLTTGDRHTDLAQKGIAPAITIFANPENRSGMGVCNSGATVLKRCVNFGDAVRSYWEHK
jgi:type IV pilus assembly protein PilY1